MKRGRHRENRINSMINWDTTDEDAHTISLIGERALRAGLTEDRMRVEMSITACHLNDSSLRLADLLAADDFNFLHDVCGIDRHTDRKTGKLNNFFCPRFAAQGKKEKP